MTLNLPDEWWKKSMPILDEAGQRELGLTGFICTQCKAETVKNYCRQCDEFFRECECPDCDYFIRHLDHRMYAPPGSIIDKKINEVLAMKARLQAEEAERRRVIHEELDEMHNTPMSREV